MKLGDHIQLDAKHLSPTSGAEHANKMKDILSHDGKYAASKEKPHIDIMMIFLQLYHLVQSVLSRLAFQQDPVKQRHTLTSLCDELQLSSIQ